ncbi:MAG: hybrid sensor histidine kinase/response regulator [Elusimicrobia bacterium]|nr:hybrid sensor histidine kinase/response regulator [Elusimicrobiota bacterium]
MKIRTKLSIAMSAVAAFSFAAAWIVSSMASVQLSLRRAERLHRRQAAALSLLAEEAQKTGARALLQQQLESVPHVLPEVEYALLEDRSGAVLQRSDPGRAKDAPPPARRGDVVSPDRSGAGRVRLGIREDYPAALSAEALRDLLPANILFALAAIALSLLSAVALAHLLSGPLARLAEGARGVGQGDLTVSVPAGADDELGELARQFNAMVVRIRELDELKDRFVESVSHDLSSPLAAIKMSLDFMLHEDPEKDALRPAHRKILSAAVENVTRLGVFIDNVLDAARIKGGKTEFRRESVELAPMIARLSELYSIVAANRGISLAFEVDPGAPAVLADGDRVERAVANLLSNALKFTRSGGSVRATVSAAQGAVEIAVADTGSGIPPEALSRVFKRFEQAGDAERAWTGVRGTGLGLYIVKETVEAMGGSVGIESEPGKGTRAWVRLPSAPSRGPLRPEPARTAGTPRVLVIDEDYSVAEMTRRLLEAKGYNAAVVNEASSASVAAERLRPDVILLDVDARECSGPEAFERLGKHPATADIPVLVCSAISGSPAVSRTLDAGAAAFVAKPLRAEDLDAAIRRILEIRRQA